MEGYLIRVPPSAWGSSYRDESTRAPPFRRKYSLHRSSTRRTEARLLYYVLGEGYLRGFAGPEEAAAGGPELDSFQLTAQQIRVEPIYSMQIIQVIATPKTKSRRGRGLGIATNEVTDTDSSDDEDDHEEPLSVRAPCQETSLLLYTGSRDLLETWGRRVLNWNRCVFGGDDPTDEELTTARVNLIKSFQELNAREMFTSYCELSVADAEPYTAVLPDLIGNAPPSESTSSQSPLSVAYPSTIFSVFTKLPPAPGTVSTGHQPWWMFLSGTSASRRRISALPM